MEAPFGETHAAYVGGVGGAHSVGVAEHNLGGPASEVDDDERSTRGVEFADSTGEGQACFLVAGDDLGLGAGYHGTEHLTGHREEVLAVARVAGRGGGHHAHRGGTCLADQVGVLHQRDPRAFDRFRRETTGGVDALAEPHDLHQTGDVGETAVLRDVGDQQTNGVGAAVDSRDPHCSSPRSSA